MSGFTTASGGQLPPLTASVPSWSATLIALGFAIITIAAAYPSTMVGAVHTWLNSGTHQFSLLVIPMTLYLIWDRREQLRKLRPSVSLAAVLLYLPLGALWLVADAVDLSIGTQVAVLGMLQAALLSLLGWQMYRALLFPLLFLWLLVPFGDSLTPSLMRLTTQVTAAGVSLFGLDATTDGNIVISEAGRVGIVAECSSLDFLIGNLVLSLFYANLVYARLHKRVLYVALGLLLAVLANYARTISVIMITHWTDGAWNLLSDHSLYGWVLFALFVVAQMSIGAFFKDPRTTWVIDPSGMITTQAASRSRIYVVTAVLIVLVVLPPMTTSMLHATPAASPPMSAELQGPAWLSPVSAADDRWRPFFPDAQAKYHATHQVRDRDVELFVGYYWQQHAGAELIGWPNAVYDRKSWHLLEQAPATISLDGEDLAVSETRLRGPQRARRLTWHWYWVDQQFTASPTIAKILQAKAELLGDDPRAAVIVVSAPEQPEPANARPAMQHLVEQAAFLKAMLSNAAQLPHGSVADATKER